MASRTTVTLVDDLDGNTADETVSFGLDGATYEVDLSSGHAEELRATLQQYVAAGRRTSGRRTSTANAPTKSSTPTSGSSRARNQEIRTWANRHGTTVGDRGRIPSNVVAAFEAGDPSRLVEREPGSSTGQATLSGIDEPQTAPSGPASSPDPVTEEAAGGEPRGRDGLTAAERERVRAWAVNEGIEVKARGQLKKDLVANYQAWSARQG